MPVKRHKPNPTEEVSITAAIESTFDDQVLEKAHSLIESCLKEDIETVKTLISEGTECWVADEIGWTSLHAAASTGNADLVHLLLRKGNAVWNLVDVLGYTAADVAWSLNHLKAYQILLGEGVRAEMIKAVLEDNQNDEEEPIGEPDDSTTKKSTASDNKTYLASRLTFTVDSRGQEVCLDAEGNGVMMNWESDIMEKTAKLLCSEMPQGEFKAINVGFGLGIIDSFIQSYGPKQHVIIEPHPDVLAHAKSKGWFEKPGVRFYEGTWQEYMADVESGKEEYIGFDVIYFDTYSEHYADLHAFFDKLPDLISGSQGRFSFFHGLGATCRSFYEIYTVVSELHLKETGFTTNWHEVVVKQDPVWESTERRYWGDVGNYRLPICWLEF